MSRPKVDWLGDDDTPKTPITRRDRQPDDEPEESDDWVYDEGHCDVCGADLYHVWFRTTWPGGGRCVSCEPDYNEDPPEGDTL